MSEETLDQKSNLTRNTKRYIEFCMQNSEPDIPQDTFPFLDYKEDGRNFSLGDLVYWYMKNKVPLSMNGPTGVGKSTAIRNYCALEKKHLSITTAANESNKNDFLTEPSVDENHKYVELPGPLPEAALHRGVFALEEAAVMKQRNFKSLAVIMQGLTDTFGTHMGVVNIPWNRLHFVMLGNFHDDDMQLGAAERYRFVWVEYKVQRGDIASQITTNKVRDLYDFDRRITGEYEQRKIPEFRPSEALIETISPLSTGLFLSMNDFAALNRGEYTNGRRNDKGVLNVESCLGKDKWTKAFSISHETAITASRLFHPEMSKADYAQVLTDVFINPAIATERVPYNDTVKGYVLGMEKIINHYLEFSGAWEKIKEAE
jgi:hypothetical protein